MTSSLTFKFYCPIRKLFSQFCEGDSECCGELETREGNSQNGEKKDFIILLLFFPSGNKEFGGVSYLAAHAWAENFNFFCQAS